MRGYFRYFCEMGLDLRPAAIIRDLDLTRPIFRYTSNYGHFGRDGFSWEETNRAQALKDYFQ